MTVETLTEIYDENGSSIKNITNIVVYKDGIVVGTDKGLYTNVEDLLRKKPKVCTCKIDKESNLTIDKACYWHGK